MAKPVIKMEGLRELDAALGELPKATGKNVLRRTLFDAGRPVVNAYRGSVRQQSGALAKSIGMGTRLSRRQSALHRKMFSSDRASVEVFLGAGALTQAITEEFGTIDQAPQGGLRSAWDGHKMQVLESIATILAGHLEKAAARAARKALKAKG